MIWKPHVTVAAVAEHDGRFLIVEEEINGALVYNQPAGHLDENEGLLTAVVRETQEETAWRFEPRALVGLYLWKDAASNTYLRVCISGQCIAHDPDQPLDNGIVQALWLSRDELIATRTPLRNSLVLRCIDDYIAGKRYPLALLNDMIT